MLFGQQVQPYRVPFDGKCWWCGQPADSREHKFKASDLRRIGSGQDDLLWFSSDGSQRGIRSYKKSSIVKFEANLCAQCNNSRSQPFDMAYSKYSDYVHLNRRKIRHSRWIDMRSVFGDEWKASTLDLARYFAKHIGCRMRHDEFLVPPSIVEFMDGAETLPDVQMRLYRDRQLWRLHKRLWSDELDAWIPYLGDVYGAVSPSEHRLVAYGSVTSVGFVGMMYKWQASAEATQSFFQRQRSRLFWRHKLPEF